MSKVIATILNLKDEFSSTLNKVGNNTKEFTSELDKTQSNISGLKGTFNSSFSSISKDMEGVSQSTNDLSGMFGQLGSTASETWVTLGAVGAGVGTVVGTFEVVKGVVNDVIHTFETLYNVGKEAAGVVKGFMGKTLGEASNAETYATAFEVLTGSAEKAQEVISDLYKFSDITPFESKNVMTATKTLMTYGLAYQKWLKNSGNLASAFDVDINETARALGRLKTGDFGEAFERLRDFGISKTMLEAQGLTFDKNGSYKGSVEKALDAVDKIINSKFGNMMEKQGGTIKGLYSTFQDQISKFFRTIGEQQLPGVKTALSTVMSTFDNLLNSPAFANFAQSIGEFTGQIAQWGAGELGKFIDDVNKLFENPTFQSAPFGQKIKMLLETATAQINEWWAGTGQGLFKSFSEGAVKIVTDVLKDPAVTKPLISALAEIYSQVKLAPYKMIGQLVPLKNQYQLGNGKSTVQYNKPTPSQGGIDYSGINLNDFGQEQTQQSTESIDYGQSVSALLNGLPHDAIGTQYTTGPVIKNERGGELSIQPNGTSILPADQTQNLLKGKGLGDIYVTLNIQGNMIGNEEFADFMGNIIVDKLKIEMAK